MSFTDQELLMLEQLCYLDTNLYDKAGIKSVELVENYRKLLGQRNYITRLNLSIENGREIKIY